MWMIYGVVSLLFLFQCHGGPVDVPTIQLPWTIDEHTLHNSYVTAYKDHPLRKALDLDWVSFLRNRSIVMIGDSLTRFQFIELVTFLHHGHWEPVLPLFPHLATLHRGPGGRENAFFTTTYYLGCQEIGDAFWDGANKYGHGFRENRYYYHFALNLSLSYFFYGPPQKMAVGLDRAPDWRTFYDECVNKTKLLQRVNMPYTSEHVRNHTFIYDFITAEVKPMHPDLIMINHGFWSGPNVQGMSSISKSMLDAAPRAVWKTTTSSMKRNRHENDDFLKMVQELGMSVFDAYSITYGISFVNASFIDPMHYLPFVYRELNIIYLDYLKKMFTTTIASDRAATTYPLGGTL